MDDEGSERRNKQTPTFILIGLSFFAQAHRRAWHFWRPLLKIPKQHSWNANSWEKSLQRTPKNRQFRPKNHWNNLLACESCDLHLHFYAKRFLSKDEPSNMAVNKIRHFVQFVGDLPTRDMNIPITYHTYVYYHNTHVQFIITINHRTFIKHHYEAS